MATRDIIDRHTSITLTKVLTDRRVKIITCCLSYRTEPWLGGEAHAGILQVTHRVLHHTGHPNIWLCPDSNMIPLISLSALTLRENRGIKYLS